MAKDIFTRVPRLARSSLYLYRLGFLVIILAMFGAGFFNDASTFLCFGSLIIMLVLIWISHILQAKVVKQALAADRQACMSCGYDLRATLASGQCPECGSHYQPETLRDEWDAWLIPGRYDAAVKAPHPRYVKNLRLWYLLGFAGLPLGYIVYVLSGSAGWAVSLVLFAPLVAAVVSGLKFGALMEKIEAAKFKVCTECGYDLQAHPPEGTCPECGRTYAIETNIFVWKNWCLVRVQPRSHSGSSAGVPMEARLSGTTANLPFPRHAIKLRRWYWVGFAGLPLGFAMYEIVGEPGWALALILLAPVVAAVLAGLKFGDLMQKVEASNFKVCTECGYDLQAHPPAGTCPECGQKYVIASNVMLWKNWCLVRDKPIKR